MRKIFSLVTLLVAIVFAITITACGSSSVEDSNEYKVYSLAVENGFDDTFDEWGICIKNSTILFRTVDEDIEWKKSSSYIWIELYKSNSNNESWYDDFIGGKVYAYSKYYTVSFNTNCDAKIDSQIVTRGSVITAPSVPVNDGYTFNGWVYENTNTLFDFKTTITKTTALEINWEVEEKVEYTISFDTLGGSLDSNNQVVCYGDDVTLPTPLLTGYNFLGWYYNDNLISDGKWLIEENVLLTAKWSLISYSITYELDNGINNVSNPDTYTIETEHVLLNPIKDGYNFMGWYTDFDFETEFSELNKNTENLVLYAKWEVIDYDIIYVLNDGTLSTTNPETYNVFDGDITLNSPSKDGYDFGNWCLESELINVILYLNDNLLSTTESTTITLYACYSNFHLNIEIYEDQDTFGSTYKYLDFGKYPQSVVLDTAITTELDKLNTTNDDGYYEYDGNEYYKSTTTFNVLNTVYWNNRELAVAATEYYFLVEPIKWRVLQTEDGIKVLSESVISPAGIWSDLNSREEDGVTVNATNYEYSLLRSFLNNDFLNRAFSSTEKDLIATSFVDNYGLQDCNDTYDKIYALSYDEVKNVDYGFPNSTSGSNIRMALTTDFAISKGSYTSSRDYVYYTYWWTRTASSKTQMRYVSYNGQLETVNCQLATYGVRPAFTFN